LTIGGKELRLSEYLILAYRRRKTLVRGRVRFKQDAGKAHHWADPGLFAKTGRSRNGKTSSLRVENTTFSEQGAFLPTWEGAASQTRKKKRM